MRIKAALLDENGVYLRMVEVRGAELTVRHLPSIKECDLPPGRYKWVPEEATFNPKTSKVERNPYGGRFVALEYLGLSRTRKTL